MKRHCFLNRICLLFILSVFALSTTFAQDWTSNLPQRKVRNNTLNFKDFQKAFYKEYPKDEVKGGVMDNGFGEEKIPGWKVFKRWEWFMESRVDKQSGNFPEKSASQVLREFNQQNIQNRSAINGGGSWTNAGPGTSNGGYAGIGRLNCIGFHPSDNNTFWVGAPAGGVWKTTDGGNNWSVSTDDNDVLGVSTIAVHPDYDNNQTLFIGTGDRDGGSMSSMGGGQSSDNYSIGILKSTNGGNSWSTTGLTFTTSQKRTVNEILIHPDNPQIMLAATSVGIFKSNDGGASWNVKIEAAGGYYINVVDMDFKPGSPSVIYASTKGWGTQRIFKSSDSGENWSEVLSLDGRRIQLAVSANNPNVVYALAANASRGLEGIYKSTNSGSSFTNVFSGASASMLGYYCDGSGSNTGQGAYDLCLAADPNNANVVFLGGVNTWKSTDGGSSWVNNNMWTASGTYNSCGSPEVHADKHYLAFQNGSSTLFECNDGGVYKTTNGGSNWTDLTNGMQISQLYRIGVSTLTSGEVVAGLQDNGTKLFATNWRDVKGGDGMECIIDYTDDNVQYGTYVEGQLDITTNHWASRSDISANIPGGNNGAWVSPYVIDPVNNQTLYIGYEDVWKTTNRGNSWTQLSNLNIAAKIKSLVIAPSNNQVLYMSDLTKLWKTTNGGSSWSEITNNLPAFSNDITYIAIKSDDPNTVWITLGEYNNTKVFETTDGGSSWTNISSGLPSLPVMTIVQNKQNTVENELYVGTDVGVYQKIGANNWTPYCTNLPNVVVTELEIYYDANNSDDSKLWAATFGRGLWSSPLPSLFSTQNPSSFNAATNGSTDINLGWDINANSDNVVLAYSLDETFGTPVNGSSYTLGDNISGGGTVAYIGDANSFNHTSLSANTTYFYKIWSYDGSEYSSGLTANATTACGDITSFPVFEGFEGGEVPPDCWTSFRGTNNEGDQIDWAVTTNNVKTGSYSAFLRYEDVANVAEDWLVSPKLVIPNSSSSVSLSYWERDGGYPQQYTSTYKIKVSTTSPTDHGSFTDVLTYAETDLSTNYTQKNIDLSAYIGQEIYVAFVIAQDDGEDWYLDDIEFDVVEGSNNPPVADFSVDQNSVCEDVAIQFNDLSANSPTEWLWDFGDGNNSTSQNPSHSFSVVGTYNISLTVTNDDGTDIETKNNYVTINANPTVNAGSALAAICQGSSSFAMGGSIGGGATGGTWTGGVGSWSNATDIANATYTAASTESGSVTLTLTTSGGSCGVLTDTKNINVTVAPNAGTIAGANTINVGNSTSLSTNGDLGGTWSSDNNAVATVDASSGLVQGVSSGSVTISYVVSNAPCNDNVTTYVVTVSSSSGGPYTLIPDPNFEQALIDLGHDDVIDGQVLTANISSLTSLNVSSQNISDLTGIEDFNSLTSLICSLNQLTSLDVSQNTALTQLNCGDNQLTSLDISQNYLYVLYCNDNQLTCLNLKNNDWWNSGGPDDLPSFSATNNPNLTCVEVDDPTTPPSNEYSDYFDEGVTFSTDCNYPNDCFGSSDACETTYSTDTQTGCDSYTWIDGNTYTTSVTPTTNTNHLVETLGMTFTPASIDITVGDTVTFYNTGGFHNVNGSIATFPNNPEGFYSGNASSDNWTFTHVFTIAGTYDYWCDPHAPGMAGVINVSAANNVTHTLTTADGCDSIVTLDLTITPSPTIDLGADTTLICAGSSFTLDAGDDFDTYAWSDGSTSSTLEVFTAGTYLVTATKANGCTAQDSAVIDVLNVEITQNDTAICLGDSLVLGVGASQNFLQGSSNSQLTGTLNNGLVAYFPFNGNANDESGNNNNGTVNGATLTNDRNGNPNSAYDFDGVNDFIQVTDHPSLNPTEKISINLWFKIENNFGGNGNNTLVDKPFTSHNNPFYQYHIGISGNHAGGQYRVENDLSLQDNWVMNISNNNSYSLNNWYMLSLTFDGSVFKSFIDGELFNQTIVTGNLDVYNQDLFIGKHGNLNSFTPAIIDDIAIYNRALNEQEVQQLYSGESYSYAWSPTNETTSSITVNPTENTTYTVDVTSGSTTCQESVNINVVDCDNTGPKTFIPDDNFEAYLENNGMGDGFPNNDSVLTENISGVAYLDVSNQDIVDLTGIEAFVNLNALICVNNLLTELDISQNFALRELNCRYNQISSLEVSQNTGLTSLVCNDNVLTSLDVSNNTSLEHLGCEDNELTSIDVSNNTALIYFICGDNQIASLDVSQNTALTYLGCHANLLTELDVSNNSALTVLSFGENQITAIDVSHLSGLTKFWCYSNALTCVNLKNGSNVNLSSFDAIDNPDLTCIEVDNPTWAEANWTYQNLNVDSIVTYSTNCGYSAGCFANSGGGGGDGYSPGTVHCNGTPTAVVEVTNPITGKTWMDRNLGASRAATSSTDEEAYGDLYQWGRGADGHQCSNSSITSTLSSTDQPGHGDIIIFNSGNYDWRSPQNDNLWQGVNGINNPCPSGYRIPTDSELDAERLSWSSNNSAGAFASALKLPMAGFRERGNGSFYDVGTRGDYWSSIVSGANPKSRSFYFESSGASMDIGSRANGFSVRCIKD